MENRDQFRRCLINYNNWLVEGIDTPVRKALNFRPEELETLFRDLTELIDVIANDQNDIESLDSKNRSYLKSAILYSLETQTEESNRRSKLTDNKEVIQKLEQEVKQISDLTLADWFVSAVAFEAPKLEKFLIPQKSGDTNIAKNTNHSGPILDLKPNFYGLGIDLRAAWARIIAWFKKRNYN